MPSYTLLPASRLSTGDVLMRVIAGVETDIPSVTCIGRVQAVEALPDGGILVVTEPFGEYQRRWCVQPTYAFWVQHPVSGDE